ncbi:molybdopterin cofactor-binding domain-containing protein [Methylobrevis albus]|uniref:Molybdopterin-dependent oxidoreductase n=1 Tax=Methylobrevis albus TaxID=2793297 RepID=A0A931N0F5_9HYPH|nr:molybdopterin cofactor-binding domain-containing protein [Methylobrevis albus]MBH0239139.1 molybdopterin-dependent oxidoreductase [Methylobrevis albus]
MSRPSRRDLLRRSGVLAVVTPRAGAAADDPDIQVCLTDDGAVIGFCGHVDLGTGIRTALAQIVAEELDVAVAAVTMVLGDTAETPDQGPTIASETIQVTAVPLRQAAAQARRALLALAAERLGVAPADLGAADGRIIAPDGTAIPYADLLANRRQHLVLDPDVPLKPVAEHRIVGRSVPRGDIPEKATGKFAYVHDVRVPGMLHGRVVRPPYHGLDHGDFVGSSLVAVDRASVAHLPGVVAVVVEGDFVGVVAEREEQAIAAAAALRVSWKPFATGSGLGPDPGSVAAALRANPSTPRKLIDEGDVEAALAAAPDTLARTYVWPYHMHGAIGPSCAVADVRGDAITVWSGTQSPYPLRADLARLTGLAPDRIDLIRLEAAGCYGRNCADDVTADAVLLSRAVGRPVRAQLTREQEHLWEPKGAAQVIDVTGALGPDGGLAAYDFETRYPSNAAPTLALLLTGIEKPQPTVLQMGDRTARPPYAYDNLRVTVHDMAPVVRAAWLRGVSAMPNVFAHESFIDELAEKAGADPVAFRLEHIDDPRAAALVRATAERAGWTPRGAPTPADDAEVVTGRGFAQARYVHGKWPGVGAAWSAWAADVAVNRRTGEVTVTRVTVGQDTGLMVNPAGVRHQLHGNVVQSVSRVLKEEVSFTETAAVADREWGAYPLITFPELPAVDVLLLDRQDEPPMGAGESASVPAAAAIVNAVYDATGVRFRELPLTPERVLAGLGRPLPKAPPEKRKLTRGRLAALGATVAAGLAGFVAGGPVLRGAIAEIPRPDPATWSASTIERGRQLAAIGACAVCHTVPGGAAYAGGLELETPFGTIVTTNITPDPATGIGGWSYPAFERAMRAGIHRDGRQLYPAFPYPNYAMATDADLSALYAFLMSQPAVAQETAPSRLTFPFNLRPLMAGWNLLFHRPAEIAPEPLQSYAWNRGRYLVDGLGHCGACHSPRGALGEEKAGTQYLAGGFAEGWEAPALGALSNSPVPWTEDALFAYLRTGVSAEHGAASGPMEPVVAELRAVPDADLRAMATYLASLGPAVSTAEASSRAEAVVQTAALPVDPRFSAGASAYDSACASCHEAGIGMAADAPSLALDTGLHSERPDNFLRVVIEGIAEPSGGGLAAMPAFGPALDDRRIAEIARYARARFAPDKAPWDNLEATIARLRGGDH